MNPNHVNKFSEAVTGLDVRRSTFLRPSGLKTTFNAGVLIPLYWDEVLPGDTMKIDMGAVIRMATPKFPTMDNAFFDVFAFYVPNRLLWDHWKEFNGENNTDFWTNKTEYSVPQLILNFGLIPGSDYQGKLLDYLGIPVQQFSKGPLAQNLSVNVFPFRAYVKIWNDWFRDENCQVPAHLYTDDIDRTITSVGDNLDNYVIAAELGGSLCPVNKFHDYFTSALPQPQKHAPISIPLGDLAPVVVGDYHAMGTNPNQIMRLGYSSTGAPAAGTSFQLLGVDNTGASYATASEATAYSGGITYSNLSADLSSAVEVTVNQLRLAFQTQKFYEKQARGGSRYTEILRSMFGVRSSDARLQRAEYLGGKRIPVSQNQVLSTSAPSSDDPLGQTGAFSLTSGSVKLCNKSFEEHGILMICGCVRTRHTYQQGIDRQFFRKNLMDYYFPVFANIGEQPIYMKEIYAEGNSTDESVFGYQEAWAEYRYKPSRTSGYMRSGVLGGSLDSWHYGDYFANAPVLSDDFIRETVDNIDRTIAVPSGTSHQFFADFYFQNLSTRAMPVYSVPGLIDHH